MTIFESNLNVQPLLTDAGEKPPPKVQEAIPDTIDLSHMARDGFEAGKYEWGAYGDPFIYYDSNLNNNNPIVAPHCTLTRLIAYVDGHIQVMTHFDDGVDHNSLLIMNWYQTAEERSKWHKSTWFLVRNMRMPSWMKYDVRRIVRNEDHGGLEGV